MKKRKIPKTFFLEVLQKKLSHTKSRLNKHFNGTLKLKTELPRITKPYSGRV